MIYFIKLLTAYFLKLRVPSLHTHSFINDVKICGEKKKWKGFSLDLVYNNSYFISENNMKLHSLFVLVSKLFTKEEMVTLPNSIFLLDILQGPFSGHSPINNFGVLVDGYPFHLLLIWQYFSRQLIIIYIHTYVCMYIAVLRNKDMYQLRMVIFHTLNYMNYIWRYNISQDKGIWISWR